MRHKRLFQTEKEFEAKIATIAVPWVVYVKGSGNVYYSVLYNTFKLDSSQLDVVKLS